VDLFVSTSAPLFDIEIYRMGWYQGLGGRLVQQPITGLQGKLQSQPSIDPTLRTVACQWTSSHALTIPTDWLSGVYLAKLISAPYTDSAGANKPSWQSYIIFVVRNDPGTQPILFQCAVTTYQAYNFWGGISLYGDDSSYEGRAVAVSFDRPYGSQYGGFGSGHFLYWEYPMVRWLERHGYDVAYSTSIDTHSHPGQLLRRAAFISCGHDEYWSWEMRAAVENARDAGVSLGFFGGNPMYWQIRLEHSQTSKQYRTQVCYKHPDPIQPPSLVDPALQKPDKTRVTCRWRDAPVKHPEQNVVGQMYGDWFEWSCLPYQNSLVVQNTDSWPYAGTGLRDGDLIPGVIGGEYDRVHVPDDDQDRASVRPELLLLTYSKVVARGYPKWANTTLYVAPSGARVFSAGSIYWCWGLENLDSIANLKLQDPASEGHYVANASLQRLTSNVLNSFLGPAMVADFASGAPPAEVHYVAPRRTQTLSGWLDPDDIQLAGDFIGLGYDQVLCINRSGVGGRVVVFDFSDPSDPTTRYWEQWGQSDFLDGWHDNDDIVLAGDFMGLGHDQVMFINNDRIQGSGRLMIADFIAGQPPAKICYWESWGQSHLLDGWQDPGDRQLVGDFLNLGRDQLLIIKKAEQVLHKWYMNFAILDFSSGQVPARQLLSGPLGPIRSQTPSSRDLFLVGDFLNQLNQQYDQIAFLNRSDQYGDEIFIVDFPSSSPAFFGHSPTITYPEGGPGLDGQLDEWMLPANLQLAGDFKGLGLSQFFFLNRQSIGDVRVAIFRKDNSTGGARWLEYWEPWGQSAMLDWWQDSPIVLVGRFLGCPSDQILFLNNG
jgi:hypothetical protein